VGLGVDVHRGQRGRGQRAVPVVVKPDHGEVGGRGQPGRAHGREHAQRDVVVEGGHRADRISGSNECAEGVGRSRSG
jgi:hypothetical protein